MSKFETDETLSLVLLGGFVVEDKKLPRIDYLKPDSREELAARAALARLLRKPAPLTAELREQLAALFDPVANAHPAIERRIVFRHRRRGKRPQHMRNTQIAHHIWDRLKSGWKVERAVKDAIDRYDLSREEIYRIWCPYRRLFEAVDEPAASPNE